MLVYHSHRPYNWSHGGMDITHTESAKVRTLTHRRLLRRLLPSTEGGRCREEREMSKTYDIPEEVQAVVRMTATIAKLEAQKADLLAALKALMQKYETIYCDCVLVEFPQSQPFDERPEVTQARAAIAKAEGV